ncbi:radical SAM protein [candidate division NPL-UPA2 bacterium]|nr:radical SAM protein [candidate division NPL-UPA2 bacterium]
MGPYIARRLDGASKLKLLGARAQYDVCGYPSIFSQNKKRPLRFNFIYPAVGEGGRCTRLFKVLQTNICQGNCFYCANRRYRDFPRLSFKPEELARLFMENYRKGVVEGLFLSSAIYRNPDHSQEETLKTIKILRHKYCYQGYIHYKILPGVDTDLIKEASKLSDRLSINLEAPGEKFLKNLTPTKKYEKLLSQLKEIARIDRVHPLRAGITTQLVVGPGGEADRDILNLAHRLYQDHRLWRVYYSGFTPLRHTPLENNSPCSPWREARLYQADFLLRKYRFSSGELLFDEEGNLPHDIDPKLAWAREHPDVFPIEVNKAGFWKLVRVPGIGRLSARRILEVRRSSKIKDLTELKKLGAVVKRARNFITLNGRFFPKKEALVEKRLKEQLFLWEEI